MHSFDVITQIINRFRFKYNFRLLLRDWNHFCRALFLPSLHPNFTSRLPSLLLWLSAWLEVQSNDLRFSLKRQLEEVTTGWKRPCHCKKKIVHPQDQQVGLSHITRFSTERLLSMLIHGSRYKEPDIDIVVKDVTGWGECVWLSESWWRWCET